jgi:hypothetical protein
MKESTDRLEPTDLHGSGKKPWLEVDNDFCGFTTTGLNNLTSACKIPGEGISDFDDDDM